MSQQSGVMAKGCRIPPKPPL